MNIIEYIYTYICLGKKLDPSLFLFVTLHAAQKNMGSATTNPHPTPHAPRAVK